MIGRGLNPLSFFQTLRGDSIDGEMVDGDVVCVSV